MADGLKDRPLPDGEGVWLLECESVSRPVREYVPEGVEVAVPVEVKCLESLMVGVHDTLPVGVQDVGVRLGRVGVRSWLRVNVRLQVPVPLGLSEAETLNEGVGRTDTLAVGVGDMERALNEPEPDAVGLGVAVGVRIWEKVAALRVGVREVGDGVASVGVLLQRGVSVIEDGVAADGVGVSGAVPDSVGPVPVGVSVGRLRVNLALREPLNEPCVARTVGVLEPVREYDAVAVKDSVGVVEQLLDWLADKEIDAPLGVMEIVDREQLMDDD